MSFDQPDPRLLGVVLCGGRSSRMGHDKSAVTWSGKSFLSITLSRLECFCNQVVVSGESSVEHGHTVVHDPVQHQGPIIGVLASLQFADRHQLDAALVCAVDLPKLSPEHLTKVVEAWQQDPKLTVASTQRVQPLIAIYPVGVADAIAEAIDQNQRSLARWIGSIDHQTVALPAESCRNINTPDDLSKLSTS